MRPVSCCRDGILQDLCLESLSSSSTSTAPDKLSLLSLQSKMKCDPQGYESELILLYRHFDSTLYLYHQQAAFNIAIATTAANNNTTIAKDLSHLAMFLSHAAPYYPHLLSDFPKKLSDLLHNVAPALPSRLRCDLTRAFILLVNGKIVEFEDYLALFVELQTLGDKALKKLVFSHLIERIRGLNQKHKNEAKNRALQNVLFSMLQEDNELKAKRCLVLLCDLHRRRVWFDDRTANAICRACFHPSSRIRISALSFLLGYERIEHGDDSDGSSAEDDMMSEKSDVFISRMAIYKAHHKGTLSSKKKKKAKLQRTIRSMKRKQRVSSENSNSCYHSPLNHLKDAQGFVEKLFSCLQTCNERFEVRMMMLKVVARTVGLHRLILLKLYPFLQKYLKPHQREVTALLAAAVQACHDLVPPDAVDPLFKQVINEFINDRSRTEAIVIGLNFVREICLRMQLLMTKDLLEDLARYKESREKQISTAARSLILLFREVCPSLLVKKDRGRNSDANARPRAFGEVIVASGVPGLELQQSDDDMNSENDESVYLSSDNEGAVYVNEDNYMLSAGAKSVYEEENDNRQEDDEADKLTSDTGDSDGLNEIDDEEEEEQESDGVDDIDEDKEDNEKLSTRKRKFVGHDEQQSAEGASLQAGAKAKKAAKIALANSKMPTFKIPDSEQLRRKRVDPAVFEARKKLTKEEKLESIRAGREERGKYQARAAVKQKKTGGLSNRQKAQKKEMPLAARRIKVARSRQEKKKKQRRAGKQFRGRKAWK
ncbi:hypothetical protein AQUCO_09500042v1 [Aquilegia coerulea]|uniref:Protein SDA1 n=2 Tax=Aquilegia coerulea TaxID=218851 RepID=A0A2G5C4T6_AQUCA|nr:hypothetical protein AQUCO_09500042v1 [Aquilegia coerulea]